VLAMWNVLVIERDKNALLDYVGHQIAYVLYMHRFLIAPHYWCLNQK